MKTETVVHFPGQAQEFILATKGWGQVPHTVTEKLAQTNFNSYESKVVHAFELVTFHQNGATCCPVNLARIAAISKLDRRNAGRAVQSLIERNIIVERDGYWGINLNLAAWHDKSRATKPKQPRLRIVSNETTCNAVQQDTENRVQQDTEKVYNKTHSIEGSSTSLEIKEKRKYIKEKSPAEEGPVFDEFYEPYPRHVQRKNAEKAWKKLTADEKRLAIADIAIRREAWLTRDKEFIPHPASYLNGCYWEDEPEAVQSDYTDQQRMIMEVFNATIRVADPVKVASYSPKRAARIEAMQRHILIVELRDKGTQTRNTQGFWQGMFEIANKGVPKYFKAGRTTFDALMDYQLMLAVWEASTGRGRV